MDGEKAVLFDGWCGEPVAWVRAGDPVIGQEWGGFGSAPITYTRHLTAAEAVGKYGPVTRLVTGTGGGFESVTFGTMVFVSKALDPRPRYTGFEPDPAAPGRYRSVYEGGTEFDQACIEVNDPVTASQPCPKCGAAKGEHCKGVKVRHRAREKAYDDAYS